MAYLKEDGSLDIERINNLPIEEYMEVIGNLTKEQYQYYLSKLPINEGNEHTKAVVVDYGFEDERSGIDADVILNNLKKCVLSKVKLHQLNEDILPQKLPNIYIIAKLYLFLHRQKEIKLL